MALSKAYQEYEDKLYSITDDFVFKPEKIESLFRELLTVLPNNGKLYKYKSLENFHIDELEEKYVWFSSAKDLNDNKDCAINGNIMSEYKDFVKYLLTDNNYKRTLATGLCISIKQRSPQITVDEVEKCLDFITHKSSVLGKLRFNDFCKQYNLSEKLIGQLLRTIKMYGDSLQNNDNIRQVIINTFRQTNQFIRNLRYDTHVLSLTTSYKKDSMWAYYCGNKGICIEYDFNKIKSTELKKIFINTQKVRYGRKKKFKYLDVIKAKNENDQALTNKADKDILLQLLTKDKSWSTEDEWRVILHRTGNQQGIRIKANIISAIYMDYSVWVDEESKHILQLAKQNGWKVYVRYFDEIDVEYRYEEPEVLVRRIKRTEELTYSNNNQS